MRTAGHVEGFAIGPREDTLVMLELKSKTYKLRPADMDACFANLTACLRPLASTNSPILRKSVNRR